MTTESACLARTAPWMQPLRRAAPASTSTTPGGAARSAPSSADSSPVVGDGNVATVHKNHHFTHVSPASLASAQPQCTHGRCGGCAQCQTPADICGHQRPCNTAQSKIQVLMSAAARTRSFLQPWTNRREAHMTIRAMWDRKHEKQDTHQPPHHAVALCCATPCRRPSAASSASASLSPPAHQAPPRSSCCRCLASPCDPRRNAPL